MAWLAMYTTWAEENRNEHTMTKLIVTTREGVEKYIEGQEGLSVMELIRDSGDDELLALCGGCCSCATCHVYIDEPSFDRVGPADPGSFEDEMLDNVSADRLPSSRLSCQVLMRDDLDGITVRIAPRQT